MEKVVLELWFQHCILSNERHTSLVDRPYVVHTSWQCAHCKRLVEPNASQGIQYTRNGTIKWRRVHGTQRR